MSLIEKDELRRDMSSPRHHQVPVSQAKQPRLPGSMLLIQNVLIVVSAACLLVQGTRIVTRDTTQARLGWTLNEDSWNQWWSYSGVSGPSYWGLLNSDWFMCDKGRRQSPIDLNTNKLVYDPHLTPLRVDNNLISGVLYNDGHLIVFNGSSAALARFAWLQEHQKTNVEQQPDDNANNANATRTDSVGASGNTTTSRASRLLLRRDTSSKNTNNIFTLDEHSARFELVDSNAGFVIETSGRGDNAGSEALNGLGDAGQPPMLMRDLSNNVDLSISESDRLQSNTIGELSRHSNQDFDPESFVDNDQLAGSFDANSAGGSAQLSPNSNQVHFTGASAAYSYRFEALQLKFGAGSVQSPSTSGQPDGSEHQISGRTFAAELQLFAYNWQLYKNFDESVTRPHGLLAISVLIDTIQNNNNNNGANQEADYQKSSFDGDISTSNKTTKRQPGGNEQLDRLLASATDSLTNRGAYAPVRDLNLSALLPETEQFVTYEGSLTQPGCHESVTWLILNRPLYIQRQTLDKLRSISADELSAPNPTGSLIAGNTRPIQPTNNRPIRTNIRPPSMSTSATNANNIVS